jgi:hypothetical protein
MLHNTLFLYFPWQNKVPSMPILSQTLKGHNSETVHPFELKSLLEMYFSQLSESILIPIYRSQVCKENSLKSGTQIG